MNIKENFSLINNTPNIINISKSQIESLTTETNTPKHAFASLELRKNSIKHFSRDRILEYVKNVKLTRDLDFLLYDSYPLCVTFNQKTNSKIINLSPFNTAEVGRLSHTKLFAAILYAYTFESIITKRMRVPDNMVQPISSYLFSLFVQVFGRDFGMTGTYSNKLPGLKFFITAYILISFFGRKQEKPTYALAKQYSGYPYEQNIDVLQKNDLTDIKGLIRSLSESGTMPGFNIIKFTVKVQKMFDVQMMPMFEDVARFLSIIMTSSVSQQDIAKPFIHKYNKQVYIHMLNYMQKRLF